MLARGAVSAFVITCITLLPGCVLGPSGPGTVLEDAVLRSPPVLEGALVDEVIPAIEVSGGGLQDDPPASGSVYYFNPAHTKAESDVQMSLPSAGLLSARRYLHISGTATPDDSGLASDGLWYHSVVFSVAPADGSGETDYYTCSVAVDNTFSGYLYFPSGGLYDVHAYRAGDACLYPKGTEIAVPEWSSTLAFQVQCVEGVPSELMHLLPTRCVDAGVRYVRQYAAYLTSNCQGDLEKAKAIFEFLVHGDSNGAFAYTWYNEIYPNLEPTYESVFIASQFLVRRKGVCNDFTELFAALTRSIGIEVTRVLGQSAEGTGHEWNRVRLDGVWFRLDSTWANADAANDRKYAEFYDEFAAAEFYEAHEATYNYGGSMVEEY